MGKNSFVEHDPRRRAAGVGKKLRGAFQKGCTRIGIDDHQPGFQAHEKLMVYCSNWAFWIAIDLPAATAARPPHVTGPAHSLGVQVNKRQGIPMPPGGNAGFI